MKYASFEERFWEKVDKSGECWIWIGARNPSGYGKIKSGDTTKDSHRASWEINYGEIPEGMCVCHVCDNPPCVNPGHLFLGTYGDNMRDMYSKGRKPLPMIIQRNDKGQIVKAVYPKDGPTTSSAQARITHE